MSPSVDRHAVEIVEVAPRDGFQSIAEPLATADKIAVIEDLLGAGLRRMEIGSFVSPRAVPQMADMKEIAGHFRARSDCRLSALVPNARGAELALEQGVGELVYVVSASETHNLANVRQSVSASLGQLADIVAMRDASRPFRLRVDVATAFDCPFTGRVPEAVVGDVVRAVASITEGVEIALCDTTGRASPYLVRERFQSLISVHADDSVEWAFHGHDTFGMGVANALMAREAGVLTIDASTSGLGGCPFAPGASGNTATEDLVFALEEGGIATGVDLARLLPVADRISRLPGACVGGHLRDVPRERACRGGPGAAMAQ